MNCGAVFSGNFCSVCGQDAATERYSIKAISRELAHNLRKIDITATFFTFIELLSHPGEFVRDYLAGKRVGFINPFKFFLYALLAEVAIYAFLFRLTGDTAFDGLATADPTIQVIALFSTVFWGVCWKIFYRKAGLNTAEFAVAAVFFSGQNIFIGLLIQLLSVPFREGLGWSESTHLILSLSVTSLYSTYFARELFQNSWPVTALKQLVLMVVYVAILIAAFLGERLVLLETVFQK